MERKQIDLTFGEISTLLYLKNADSIDKKYRDNNNQDYIPYFMNNPLINNYESNNLNVVSINFKGTIQKLTSGISKDQDFETKQTQNCKVYDQTYKSETNPFNFLSKTFLNVYKKSMVTLSDNYSGKFDKYISYADVINKQIEEDIEDAVRYLLEKIEYFQGFRFVYESQSGWGYFVEYLKQYVQDECAKKCLTGIRINPLKEYPYSNIDDMINFGRLDVIQKERF